MQPLEPVTIDQWQQAAVQCPWATWFHTPAWSALMAAHLPDTAPHGLGTRLDDGTPVVLPATLRTRQRMVRRSRQLRSTEPGTYGGFLAPRPLTEAECAGLGRLLRRAVPAGRLVATPAAACDPGPGFRATQLETHMIDLPADSAQVSGLLNRGQKSNLSQARRRGVCVRQADSIEDIRNYCRLYAATRTRWGDRTLTVYPDQLLLDLYAHAADGVTFWLAEVLGQVAAGALVLEWQGRLSYWHGAARQEFFSYYPNTLLHVAIMQEACSRGCTCYDLGPSAGLAGVAQFKSALGGRVVGFNSYRWK